MINCPGSRTVLCTVWFSRDSWEARLASLSYLLWVREKIGACSFDTLFNTVLVSQCGVGGRGHFTILFFDYKHTVLPSLTCPCLARPDHTVIPVLQYECVQVCVIKYVQWFFLGTEHVGDSYFCFNICFYFPVYLCLCITFIIRKMMNIILKLEREIHTWRHKKWE